MLTGEPDAGNLQVRFGGRGGANQCAIPTPYHGATLRVPFWDFPVVDFVRSRKNSSLLNFSGIPPVPACGQLDCGATSLTGHIPFPGGSCAAAWARIHWGRMGFPP